MAKKPHKREIELFGEWFKLSRGVANPTDLNTAEKYDFAMKVCEPPEEAGDPDEARHWYAMVKQRKGGVREYPFIAYDYWHAKDPVTYPANPKSVEQTSVELDDVEGTQLAKWCYGCFFRQHPEWDNPSDITDDIREACMRRVGWAIAVWMHKARKKSKPWAFPEYWTETIEALKKTEEIYVRKPKSD